MTDDAQIDVTTFRPGLASIRRRRWYLWLVIAGYLPSMWLLLQQKPTTRAIVLAFAIWFVLLLTSAIAAAAARCPRCGNYFHMHGMTLLYFRKCLHCQLHINADKQ